MSTSGTDDHQPTAGERVKALLTRWQHSRPGRALGRYGKAGGGLLAGGITYSALFSIFAALTIGYTIFMSVLGDNDELREDVLESVNEALPGIIDTGGNEGLVRPEDLVLDTALNPASIIAAAVLLWTAITVMGALRRSIRTMFGIVAPKENPVLIRGRDLVGFLSLALAVVLTAALGIAAGTAGQWVLGLVGIEGTFASVALRVLGFLAAFLVDAAVFVLLFRVLAGVHVPRRDLLTSAALGAVAAGVLRFVGTTAVGGADDPLLATAAALITLLLWVNLLARITLMISAWAANPPAPPKPADPSTTKFDEFPNYVTLSAPHTLTWDYEPVTGTVEPDAAVLEETRTADLEQLGEEGQEVLATLREQDEQARWNERTAVEDRAREAYWGGAVGAVRRWNQSRLRRRNEAKDAAHAQRAERRRARGERR